ncbi:MAG TPA: hypothetical protein VHE30_02750 [Polyangiaceae bacterium]|nr:hypothetical protein [Polyangiaceae bacterium]
MARPANALASIIALTLVTTACSHAMREPAAPATAKVASRKTPAKAAAPAKPEEAAPEAPVAESENTLEKRKLGDFHVYEYRSASGKPLSLTEQVVAREGSDILVVDFVLQEGDQMSALRVRMRGADEVLKVSRITAEGEADATKEDYEALMQRTAFVPDSNDELIGTEHTSCMVGTEQVDCDVTSYQVTVGKKQAKLSITRSANVPGRDIGGDVVTADGKVLYSARLVERGNEPPVVESFAKLDETRFVPVGP